MLRTLTVAAALVAGLLAPSVDALACSCLQPDVIYSYRNYDHTVVARAVSMQRAGQWDVWTFRLVKDLKECARPGATFRVATSSSSAACGTSFTPGATYLLFASDTNIAGQPRWTTNSCAGNTEVSQVSRADMAYLMDRPLFCGGQASCVDGTQPLNCLVDPCSVAAGCAGGTCESNYCGGCTAEWYDPMGYGMCMPW